jgi:nucleotide-binding universal stress UspA family protein
MRHEHVNETPKIQRILFATDFLESSRLALDYAVVFAHHFRAKLRMLHVVELLSPALEAELVTSRPSLTRKAALVRLEALAAGVRRAGIEVETVLLDGIPADEIIRAACDNSCDLLVLGIHGVHRGVDHLLIGSNAEKILLASRCPTLTVGAHVMAGMDLESNFNKILYFADFTPESAAAAPYAVFFGKEFGVPVEMCQLIPALPQNSPEESHSIAELYCDRLRNARGDNDPLWGRPEYQLDRGLELQGILERAESEHAGLIVLGVRTPSRLDRHLHTSFAYQLLARSTCPVLSVLRHPETARPGEDGAGETSAIVNPGPVREVN